MEYSPSISPGNGYFAIIQDKNKNYSILPVVVWFLAPNGAVCGMTHLPGCDNLLPMRSVGAVQQYVQGFEEAKKAMQVLRVNTPSISQAMSQPAPL